MAKQHLYSRVPAKLSMYNRYDSFDTFAHSEGLTREFVEGELSCVYANKLSKNDMEAVRKGQMPQVYSQCSLRSGQIAQTCIHYLPLDYTGERSSYLSHTLILTKDEENQLLYSQHNAAINPRMFLADVSGFDFTSASAAADSSYPEAAYLFCPVEDTKEQISQYDPDTFKKFLSAIFAVLCAKSKAVYFKLDCPDAEASEKALKLLSTVIAVIPFHLRKDLSFVTYVTDPAQYAHTKVKCLSANCPDSAPAKGTFLDLHTGLVIDRLPSGAMADFPVEFFYSLLKNPTMRNNFLAFMDTAVNTIPALAKLSIKTLSDLVFLFCGSSDAFVQHELLPTDAKVFDFLCVYEKYRSVLDQESRKNVYACLDRYPKRHEAIPKNIFTKLSRLYPDEPHCVKRSAIGAILELLHTDIMRDKLFTFIKNNYSGEDADIRAMIHSDLCRVYYGGFLQPQILAFFSKYFSEEAETTQDTVLEKVLLTIRTEAVQAPILEFIGANYGIFTARQKQAFYHMFFEMLPECDRLSSLLINLVNTHITQETPQQQKQLRQKIQELVLSDQKKADRKLMPLLCQNNGFCSDAVQELVFGEQGTEEMFNDYIAMLSQKTVFQKTETLLQISNLPVSTDPDVTRRLILSLPKLFAEDTPQANLHQWLEADCLTMQVHQPNPFTSSLRETVIQPGIAMALPDVFDVKLFPDGIGVMEQYAQEHTYLTETVQYQTLKNYRNLEKAIADQDVQAAFQCLHMLMEEPVRREIAGRIQADFFPKTDIELVQYVLYQMSVSVLKDGKLLPERLYSDSKDLCLHRNLQNQGGTSDGKQAERKAAVCAAEHIFGILTVACRVHTVYLQMLEEDKPALDSLLAECRTSCGNGVKKKIQFFLAEAPTELQTAVQEALDRSTPKSDNIFAWLFGKKR